MAEDLGSAAAEAGIATGSVAALDATVRITDGVDARIATNLSPRLLAIARTAAERAAQAPVGENDELEACLVAILAGHAAVEAKLNEAAELDRNDPDLADWWEDREPLGLAPKWADLVERLTGTRPARGSATRGGIVELSRFRNGIAHGRGIKQPGQARPGVSGPPDSSTGRSRVRATLDRRRAAQSVSQAEAAMAAVPDP